MKPSQERVSAAPPLPDQTAGWGGFTKVFLLIPASCLSEKESLLCHRERYKSHIILTAHAGWPVQSEWPLWRCFLEEAAARPQFILTSLSGFAWLNFLRLPSTPSRMDIFASALYLRIRAACIRRLYKQESEQQYLVFLPQSDYKVFVHFFLLLEEARRPRRRAACCVTGRLPGTLLQEHTLLCSFMFEGLLWKSQSLSEKLHGATLISPHTAAPRQCDPREIKHFLYSAELKSGRDYWTFSHWRSVDDVNWWVVQIRVHGEPDSDSLRLCNVLGRKSNHHHVS